MILGGGGQVGCCGIQRGERVPHGVKRSSVGHFIIRSGLCAVELDVERLAVVASGHVGLTIFSTWCRESRVPVFLHGHGLKTVRVVGSQLLLGEMDVISIRRELAPAHRPLCDKAVRLIIHVEREATDMVFEHVCPLNIIVIDEIDVQACRTVAQVFCHHVATTYGQCGHRGQHALLYDVSNVHCRLEFKNRLLSN